MRRLYLPLVVLIGITACNSAAKQDAAPQDPKAPALEPAVINVPLNVPTPNAPATANTPLIPTDRMERVVAVSSSYSLASATMVRQDGRMLIQLYAPDAVLKTPETTVMSGPAVVSYLMNLAREKSLSSFQRTSLAIGIIDDSTLADSGSYTMVLKRTPTDSVLERGRYTAKWRARSRITDWVILEDQITPDKPAKRAGAK